MHISVIFNASHFMLCYFLVYSKQVDEDIAEEDGSGKEGEEQWDLTKIMTVEELNMPSPQLCSYANDKEKKCRLIACCKYERVGAEPWYYCLDCQQE